MLSESESEDSPSPFVFIKIGGRVLTKKLLYKSKIYLSFRFSHEWRNVVRFGLKNRISDNMYWQKSFLIAKPRGRLLEDLWYIKTSKLHILYVNIITWRDKWIASSVKIVNYNVRDYCKLDETRLIRQFLLPN